MGYKQLQLPSFSPTCLVTPSCLWGASVGVGPQKGACVFQRSFEGIFSQPFLGVIHLNLIVLLNFELNRLSLLLTFKLDRLPLLLSLEL
jgi:hypothetical protein